MQPTEEHIHGAPGACALGLPILRAQDQGRRLMQCGQDQIGERTGIDALHFFIVHGLCQRSGEHAQPVGRDGLSPEELGNAAGRSKRVGDEQMSDDIRWIRSYVLSEDDGRVGTVCIYEASSPEAIRKHAERAELAVDEIIPVADTVVIRADPAPASTS